MRSKKYTCAVARQLSEDQKKQWQELWNSSDTRHIFNSPNFFESCLEAFKSKKYAIIFCYKESKLCGVLPLVEDRIFGIKALSGPGRKGNYIDKSILLVSEYDLDLFNAIIESALSLGNLYLAEINEDVKILLNRKKFKYAAQWASRSRWEAMSEEKSIVGHMPSKQKRTMLKRIGDREKNLDFRLFKADLQKALEKAAEIEKGSYKSRRHISFFNKAISKIFLQSVIKYNPENVCIGVLYFHNKPIATTLGFIYGKTFLLYHTAFLKEHYGWGAGKAAIYFALECLKKEGFAKMDLSRGDSDLKRQFAENTEDQYNIYFSKNHLVLFWWRMCALTMDILKKIKSFIESAALSLARKKILTEFFSGKKNIFDFMRQSRRADNRGKINNNKPVAIFSSYDDRDNPHYAGGGARAVHEAAKRLTKQFEVRVLAGKYRGCPRSKVLDGVYYEYVGSCLFGPKLGQLIFHFMLPFYAAAKSFDVWIESFTPPFSTSFLPLFTKKPVIGLAHMFSAEDMLRKYKIPFHLVENLGIKAYRNFIVLTEETEKKIKKLNSQARVEVIPNGVSFPCVNNQSVKKHFLFIGRIEINQKGLDLLLDAYKSIEIKTDYSLAIVGRGNSSEEKKLMEMIYRLGLSERVKFFGRLEDDEKLKMFQEAISVIIPSRFETFSLVALESLSQNVPVISFNIEGLKWLPPDFSIKAKPFDVSSLAQKMLEMSAGNNSLAPDESKVKDFLANYDWDVIAEKYGNYFNSILKTKLKK